MSANTVNASLQLVPLTHLQQGMPLIDRAIEYIRQSGLVYEVGPFGTSVEGSLDQVLDLVKNLNQQMHQSECPEWLINIQLHVAADHNVAAADKTAKHR